MAASVLFMKDSCESGLPRVTSRKAQGHVTSPVTVIPAGFWRESSAAPLLDSRLKLAAMTE